MRLLTSSRNRRLKSIAAWSCGLLVSALSVAQADSRYISITGSAWRLALGDVNGDGQAEFLFGGCYGSGSPMRLVSSAGQTRWTSPRWR